MSIQTSFGLEVSYDGNFYIAVGLDRTFQENIRGMPLDLNSMELLHYRTFPLTRVHQILFVVEKTQNYETQVAIILVCKLLYH